LEPYVLKIKWKEKAMIHIPLDVDVRCIDGLAGKSSAVIVGAAAGAASGGVAAGKIDMGFPDNFLKKLQEGLQPDNSALVILLERDQTTIIAEAAASQGGQFMQHELTQDILAQLTD
jgi:uncharacterized membrane protein